MASTAWNPRNSRQFEQQRDTQLSSGRTLVKAPSSSRTGRSGSLFGFGSKKPASPQITPFTPNISDSVNSQQAPMEQNQTSNDPSSSQHVKRPSLVNDAPQMNPALVIQREIKSVVDLALAHAHKIYYSGPLIRRVERLADGNKPALDEGWVDVWAQLGGTTLSVWDMKAIEEASKRGEEVPPSYVNITDCFVQVLGALTSPATPTTPSKRYTNVITLNTAGSNLIFFACPSSAALVAWATSIRLAGWEKSRLEEIYTGHLLRMTLSDNGTWSDPPSTLSKGRLEGFVKARISGHTDWKTFWMSLTLSTEFSSEERAYRSTSPVTSTRSKHRVSNLFSRGHQNDTQTPGPSVPVISFYASPKPKDRKRPLLTMRNVTQAYAVYPERPEVIQKSTLIKIEGHLGTEDVAGPMKGRECWIMIMPETQQPFPVLELVKWLIAIHDMYSLYGRPNTYVWDPRQPASMWFGYPVGNQREHLFVTREEAERLDPRDDRTSSIRTQLTQILIQRMYASNTQGGQGKPVETMQLQTQLSQQQSTGQGSTSPPPPTTVTVDPQPTETHQTNTSETRNVSTARSVSNSPPNQSQSTTETTNSPLLLNTSLSTNPRPSDLQSPNPGSLSPSTNANFTSQTFSPRPLPSSDNSTQGQSPYKEAGAPSSNRGQSPPKTLPREGSSTGSNLPRPDAITSSFQSHTTTLPLHPHPKSSHAISPPRSPPLPPTPKQVLNPTEIKQPVPLNAGLANSTSPVAGDIDDLVNEPASLFVLRENTAHDAQRMKEPTGAWSRSDDEEGGSEGDPDFTGLENNLPRRLTPRSAPPNAYKSSSGENSAKGDGLNTRVRTSVGRKPSGARARPRSGLVRPPEFDTPPSAISLDQMDERSELPYDDTVSTLAAMNFFESQEGFDLPSLSNPLPPKQNISAAESTSQHLPSQKSPSPASSSDAPQFKSSFALSKQAAERHAKVQAQQEARHQPGKPRTNGGIKPIKKPSDTWAESSEEEEEEEEEEDDEGSDVEPSVKPALAKNRPPVPDVRTSVYPSAQPNASKEGVAHSRFLPQPPNNGGLDPNRGIGEDRRRTSSSDEHRAHSANHMIARQSVWSSVLDPTPPPKLGLGRDTFIQVDESETMTKAFQPQGLLSAGIQDKEDRSARRQEEVARETGVSLINVPGKPPPPQTGLLGAITAHERERKREGGVGAALTERERERRLAEERQRKLDDLQRQQLDQMSQGGMGNPYDMYGQQGFPNFMPTFDPRMSMNPMMLNPFMGFPTMPFGNPQQNMAAMMAAQQAYQQAMLSFSQAGSQAGDVPANANATAGMTTPLVPQMTGMSGIQSPMMGVDPRMSMVFNPWMMNPGAMGMGMNFPGMANMNMNPAGGLDPRMSGQSGINRPDSATPGQGQLGSLGTPSPRQNSPAPPRSSSNSPLPPPQL